MNKIQQDPTAADHLSVGALGESVAVEAGADHLSVDRIPQHFVVSF